jgi:serine/threonine protein kinase
MPSDPSCPPIEQYRELFEGARPPRQSVALLHHLESCDRCRRRVSVFSLEDRLLPDYTCNAAGITQTIDEKPPADDWDTRDTLIEPVPERNVPRRLGRYEVVSVLGSGAMGVVVKAVDPGLNRFVAIKLLSATIAGNPVYRERFAREAEAASRIGSDNVVAVYEFGEEGNTLYVVMEYVRGQSLGKRIRDSAIPPVEALRIGRQVAAGLAAAHAKGVIHRDIKPDNILLESRSCSLEPAAGADWVRVKLADFGIARLAETPGLTQPGAMIGTPEYMSPEHIGNDRLDFRSDLYSLGILMYQLLVGRTPFEACSLMELFDHHRQTRPDLPSRQVAGLPEWADELVMKLLQKDPSERFQTADEVVCFIDKRMCGREGIVTDPEEDRRLAALRRYRLLDTDVEQSFDDLTYLASHICGTPIALISLVDLDRQWFKSRLGLSVTQTARSISFCQHTIRGTSPFVVGDAAEDPRFADNVLVKGSPHIRFYAGLPLIDPEGNALGSVCVIDRMPRQLSADQVTALGAIARLVVERIRLRSELIAAGIGVSPPEWLPGIGVNVS